MLGSPNDWSKIAIMNPISGTMVDRRIPESESFHDLGQTLVYPIPVYEKSDHL